MVTQVPNSPNSRPVVRRQDFLTSIANLSVASISFALVYAYFASVQHDRLAALTLLPGLDQLLAVREIALKDDLGSRALTKRDLPQFFPRAAQTAFSPTADGTDPNTVETLDARGFTAASVQRAKIVQIVSRFRQRYCNASVSTLPPGERFNFATFQVVSKSYWTESENIRHVVFDDCLPGDNSGKSFLVLFSGQDIIVSLPENLESKFPPIAPPLPFESFRFYDHEKLGKLLPDELNEYRDQKEQMVMMHLSAIDYYILAHATVRHQKYYSPLEFETAVAGLYQEKVGTASFLGTRVPVPTLVSIGPIIYFLLSFELWRRVRRVPTVNSEPSVFWFATDTSDVIGRWTARIYAALPTVGMLIIYFSYALANHSHFVRIQDISRAVLFWEMGAPLHEALSWINFDAVATALLLLLPLHVFVVLITSLRLFRISETSQLLPQRRKSIGWRIASLRRFKRRKFKA